MKKRRLLISFGLTETLGRKAGARTTRNFVRLIPSHQRDAKPLRFPKSTVKTQP